jgi:hypothetical protein
MANVQVVPNVISSMGNVMCTATRNDGNLFGDVLQVAFASDGGDAAPAATVVQSAGGTQLFFVPEPTEEPPANQLVLPETEICGVGWSQMTLSGDRAELGNFSVLRVSVAALVNA